MNNTPIGQGAARNENHKLKFGMMVALQPHGPMAVLLDKND